MARTVLGVIAGFVAWWVVVTIIDRPMRFFWTDYQAVYAVMAFTLPMMLARLTESTIALVIAALVAIRVAPASRIAGWAFGAALLAMFGPYHLLMIWNRFPVWYHAYFLTSLIAVPLIVTAVRRETSAAAAA